METPDWFDESQFVPTPEDRLPAADIDELFEQACTNSGYLPAFQRRLPESYLLVLVRDVPGPDDVVGPYVPVAPVTLSDGRLPLFTSEARVLAGSADGKLPPGMACMSVRVRELLEQLQTRGTDAVLNPFSEHQMDLAAAGMAGLLAGDFKVDGLHTGSVHYPAGEHAITIDNHHETPPALLEALRVLLSQHPRVRAGYLLYLAPSEQQPVSRYHLRLDVEGEAISQLFQELGPVIKPFVGSSEGFEVLVGLDEDDEASAYLRAMGAFYERI